MLDDPPPFRRHAISVSGGHVLHGGPGSGYSPVLRRIFDPRRYRIVCIDQRGAGCNTQHTCWTLSHAA